MSYHRVVQEQNARLKRELEDVNEHRSQYQSESPAKQQKSDLEEKICILENKNEELIIQNKRLEDINRDEKKIYEA
jgi:hypothetical protein